jgi:hypothetical protein
MSDICPKPRGACFRRSSLIWTALTVLWLAWLLWQGITTP